MVSSMVMILFAGLSGFIRRNRMIDFASGTVVNLDMLGGSQRRGENRHHEYRCRK